MPLSSSAETNWPQPLANAPEWSAKRLPDGSTSPSEPRETLRSDIGETSGGLRSSDEYLEASVRQNSSGYETSLSAEGGEDQTLRSEGDKGKGRRNRKERRRQHECLYCPKAFDRPSSLAAHIKTHTGDKPFKCDHPGCGKDFAVRSNLTRHLRMHGIVPGTRDEEFSVSFDKPVVSYDVHSSTSPSNPTSFDWIQNKASRSDLGPGNSTSVPTQKHQRRPPRTPASNVAGSSRLGPHPSTKDGRHATQYERAGVEDDADEGEGKDYEECEGDGDTQH